LSRKKVRLKSEAVRKYVEEKIQLGYTPEQSVWRIGIDHPGVQTKIRITVEKKVV
jgi:ribosomal protein L31E